jgi:hypothetical protein
MPIVHVMDFSKSSPAAACAPEQPIHNAGTALTMECVRGLKDHESMFFGTV